MRKNATPYQRLARKLWPYAARVDGEGRYALMAYCNVLTVSLWANLDDAIKNRRMIDGAHCGSRCSGCHAVLDLDEDPPAVAVTARNSKIDGWADRFQRRYAAYKKIKGEPVPQRPVRFASAGELVEMAELWPDD